MHQLPTRRLQRPTWLRQMQRGLRILTISQRLLPSLLLQLLLVAALPHRPSSPNRRRWRHRSLSPQRMSRVLARSLLRVSRPGGSPEHRSHQEEASLALLLTVRAGRLQLNRNHHLPAAKQSVSQRASSGRKRQLRIRREHSSSWLKHSRCLRALHRIRVIRSGLGALCTKTLVRFAFMQVLRFTITLNPSYRAIVIFVEKAAAAAGSQKSKSPARGASRPASSSTAASTGATGYAERLAASRGRASEAQGMPSHTAARSASREAKVSLFC